MRTNYTPGPWAARVINTINDAPAYWHIIDQHRGVVGDVQSVNPADARLIAAAPDLLAALQRLSHPMADDDDLAHALDVIHRATGGDA